MGGSSKSESKSNSADNRTMADGNAIALVNPTLTNGSQINVTDGGLVSAALQYLDAADQRNTDRLSVLVEAGAGVLAANQAGMNSVLARASEQDTPQTMQFSQTAMLGAAGLLLAVLVIGRK